MRAARALRDSTGAGAITLGLFLGPLAAGLLGPTSVDLGRASLAFAGHQSSERPPVWVDEQALIAMMDEDGGEEDGDGEDPREGDSDAVSSSPGPAADAASPSEGLAAPAVAEQGSAVAAGERRARPGGERKRRRARCQDPDPRIDQLSDVRWQVERSILAEYTRSVAALNTLGYVKRHKSDSGRVDGLIVRGIRCGSPLHAGGLRSGDVVQRVNGKKVKTLLGGIALYAKQHRRDLFIVEIERRGRPLELVYRVI